MSVQKDYYTIIDSSCRTHREEFHFYWKKPGQEVTVMIGDVIITIDPQQLSELGVLFLGLAGNEVDYSSGGSLLDGFGIPEPEILKGKLE